MAHHDLTIVSVYGHNSGACAIPSIVRSMRELPGSRGLLLSIEKPDNLPEQVEWKKIGFLDYLQYSVFVMHSLYAYIDTEFCLIVQDDGWVLNGENFKDEYYEYDYIGGVCHAAMCNGQLWLGGSWHDQFPRVIVQNGGFSLRSKKFLEAPNKYGITHNHAADVHLWNEDVQLSCIKRHLFAEVGMKYASEKTVRDFSLESIVPTIHDNFDFSRLLGHHSTSRRLVSDSHIVVRQESLSSHREPEFIYFLEDLGYTVEYVSANTNQA